MNDWASYFQGKTIVLTGGSSGIGLAMARQLAEAGANLWLLARRESLLQETLASLKGNGTHAYLSVDVAERNQVEKAVERIRSESGTPDMLIHAAGITHPGYVQDIPLDVFHRLMEVNYFGVIHLNHAFLPEIIARGSGHLVHFSSVAGFMGVFGYAAYSPTKFALRGYSDVLRSEVKPLGLRVSVVFPPDTDTPSLREEAALKPFETKELSGTAGLLSPEQVAMETLRGMARGKYLILPGTEPKALFRLNNWLGGGVYWIMDRLIAQAKRKKSKLGE